ncbi:MAG: hypothetical protein WAL63_07415 [Solirubrobacteraceae bacterium]
MANLTAATPFLLQEVTRRAEAQPSKFSLLIPTVDPRRGADWSMESAIRLLGKAAGSPVHGLTGVADDPLESVRQTLEQDSYDEVLVSTLPKRTSDWLRKDLPTRIEQLGVPVTVVTPPEEPSPLQAFTDQFSARSS